MQTRAPFSSSAGKQQWGINAPKPHRFRDWFAEQHNTQRQGPHNPELDYTTPAIQRALSEQARFYELSPLAGLPFIDHALFEKYVVTTCCEHAGVPTRATQPLGVLPPHRLAPLAPSSHEERAAGEIADATPTPFVPTLQTLVTLNSVLAHQHRLALMVTKAAAKRDAIVHVIATETCCPLNKTTNECAPRDKSVSPRKSRPLLCSRASHRRLSALLRQLDERTDEVVALILLWRKNLQWPLPFVVSGQNYLLLVERQVNQIVSDCHQHLVAAYRGQQSALVKKASSNKVAPAAVGRGRGAGAGEFADLREAWSNAEEPEDDSGGGVDWFSNRPATHLQRETSDSHAAASPAWCDGAPYVSYYLSRTSRDSRKLLRRLGDLRRAAFDTRDIDPAHLLGSSVENGTASVAFDSSCVASSPVGNEPNSFYKQLFSGAELVRTVFNEMDVQQQYVAAMLLRVAQGKYSTILGTSLDRTIPLLHQCPSSANEGAAAFATRKRRLVALGAKSAHREASTRDKETASKRATELHNEEQSSQPPTHANGVEPSTQRSWLPLPLVAVVRSDTIGSQSRSGAVRAVAAARSLVPTATTTHGNRSLDLRGAREQSLTAVNSSAASGGSMYSTIAIIGSDGTVPFAAVKYLFRPGLSESSSRASRSTTTAVRGSGADIHDDRHPHQDDKFAERVQQWVWYNFASAQQQLQNMESGVVESEGVGGRRESALLHLEGAERARTTAASSMEQRLTRRSLRAFYNRWRDFSVSQSERRKMALQLLYHTTRTVARNLFRSWVLAQHRRSESRATAAHLLVANHQRHSMLSYRRWHCAVVLARVRRGISRKLYMRYFLRWYHLLAVRCFRGTRRNGARGSSALSNSNDTSSNNAFHSGVAGRSFLSGPPPGLEALYATMFARPFDERRWMLSEQATAAATNADALWGEGLLSSSLMTSASVSVWFAGPQAASSSSGAANTSGSPAYGLSLSGSRAAFVLPAVTAAGQPSKGNARHPNRGSLFTCLVWGTAMVSHAADAPSAFDSAATREELVSLTVAAAVEDAQCGSRD